MFPNSFFNILKKLIPEQQKSSKKTILLPTHPIKENKITNFSP